MALPPQTDETFLREVDEELRREQLLSFWQRYGRWVVIGVVVALLAFAGALYWRHLSNARAEDEGIKLQQAYDSLGIGDTAKATPAIGSLAASGRPGYRATAMMLQANALLDKGDLKGAAAKFAAIAGDDGIGKPFRDLALIRQTTAEFDTLPPQTVIDRLKPLAVKGSPWLGSAGEMTAIAYLKMGRDADARAMFQTVASDEQVPPSIRERAVQMATASAGGEAPVTGGKGK